MYTSIKLWFLLVMVCSGGECHYAQANHDEPLYASEDSCRLLGLHGMLYSKDGQRATLPWVKGIQVRLECVNRIDYD